MKKRLIICTEVLFFLFFLIQLGWVGYYSFFKDSEIRYYSRLFALNEQEQERVNWWSLFSPIQFESQSVVKDTLYLLPKKIFFPCGKSTSGEIENRYIAEEISNYLLNWKESVTVNHQLDYDRASAEVRKNKNPKVRFTRSPILNSLELKASASAEYSLYGYEQSIQRGNIEKENLNISRNRLDRIGNILENRGINISKKSITEIQLSNALIQKALKDKSVLDRYRFVEARASVSTERLKIETITFPFLFPVWIFLFLLLFFTIKDLIEILKENKKQKGMNPEIEKKDWWIVAGGVIVTIFSTFFYFLIDFLRILLLVVLFIIIAIILLVLFIIFKIYEWWGRLDPCKRVLIILSIVLLISWGYIVYLLSFIF